MGKTVKLLPVGQLKYGLSLKLQNIISDKVKKKNIPDTLIAVEHDPVYTIGIRDKSYTKEDENKLIKLGAEFFRTNRGGLITFHGPGQLVVYPIVDLRNHTSGIRRYVNLLEQTIIDLCASYGIKASTSPHTGVWVNNSKICAMGIHASQFVTTHGLALNCNIDLQWFSHIVPCGIEGKFVTSLSEQLKFDVSVEDALPKFTTSFSKYFECDIIDYNEEEIKNILNNLSH